MSLARRLPYYRRVLSAYLSPARSQLTFWHETPEINARACNDRLGEYYMRFRQKADYPGFYDATGVPMLDYRGDIGLQYNPIAIAQWGLANYNLFCETRDTVRLHKMVKAADWLCANLEQNAQGLFVWHHKFDWEYRETLKAPWYSGLAQGQGVSLLLRAHLQTQDLKYADSADRAFAALTTSIPEGGVLVEDDDHNLWIEEYIVDPPTHILNGFLWALWGVLDYWLSLKDSRAESVFERGLQTLKQNLSKFDTGYWSLYELSNQSLKMLASPFYHRLHIVQLQVMTWLTGDDFFARIAERWQDYANRPIYRARAVIQKAAFKMLYY